MPACKPRRRHRPQRAVAQHDPHGRAAIGVKHIVPDPPTRHLVKDLEQAGYLRRVLTGNAGRKIKDMDTDTARTALEAMGGRIPPQPFQIRPPMAPYRLGQPALQTDCPGMADFAIFTGTDRGGKLVHSSRVSRAP